MRINQSLLRRKPILAGWPLFRALGDSLREHGADHIFVVAGGVIPEQDYAALKQSGVDVIIPQEARAELIVSAITELVESRGRI
jgi:methylmalonyl-CoA mutase C-terminal domain/subunit